MQPRQRSQWVTMASDSSPASSSAAFIKTMRPRGESISSFHSTYVGQVGRQNPQCTQTSTSSFAGGRCSSNAPAFAIKFLLRSCRDCTPPRRRNGP